VAHACPPAPITTPMLTGPSFLDPVITPEGDRGLPTWAWIAWFNELLQCIGRAEAGADKEIIFNLAAGSASVQVAVYPTPPRPAFIRATEMTLHEVSIIAEIPPVGADLIVDVLLNDVTVFAGDKLILPDGSTNVTIVTNTAFNPDPLTFTYHDIFKVSVLQTGVSEPGRLISIGLVYTVTIQ